MNNIYKLVAVIYQKSEMLSSLDISAFFALCNAIHPHFKNWSWVWTLNVCLVYQVKPTFFPGPCLLFVLRKRKSKRDCEVKVGQKTMFSPILGLLKWLEKSCKYILVLAYFHEGHTPLSVRFTDFFIPL